MQKSGQHIFSNAPVVQLLSIVFCVINMKLALTCRRCYCASCSRLTKYKCFNCATRSGWFALEVGNDLGFINHFILMSTRGVSVIVDRTVCHN